MYFAVKFCLGAFAGLGAGKSFRSDAQLSKICMRSGHLASTERIERSIVITQPAFEVKKNSIIPFNVFPLLQNFQVCYSACDWGRVVMCALM